jgi:nicotinamide-nucleotide amidase
VTEGEKVVFCLPGVPLEMENIFEMWVYSEIVKKLSIGEFHAEQIYKYIGITESHLEEKVEKSGIRRISDENVRIAYTASFPQIDVTLSIAAKSQKELQRLLEETDEVLNKALGEYLAVKGTETIEEKLVHILQKKRWKIAVAESFTGGMIASHIVNVSGSSEVFVSGIVAYNEEAKINLLKVSTKTLKNFGAVSKECALEMAHGIREMSGADCSVSTTGFAEGKETFGFIAWVGPDFELSERYQFRWDRNRNRMLATFASLKKMIGLLTGQPKTKE